MVIQQRRTARAFTLIEMLVVVAIIGILISVLLPAFGVVRRNAKYAQAQAMFGAIRTGLQMFETEQALGTLPPSVSDHPGKDATRDLVKNPRKLQGGERNNNGESDIHLTGGQLLVHAMIGADGLGAAGFRDLDRDGQWWNDYGDESCSSGSKGGLYGLDDNAEPCQPRYGGGGYVDEKARSNLKSIRDLVDAGTVLTPETDIEMALDEPMFVDPWDTPVLYYRANNSASRVLGSTARSGIYWLEDNGPVTGVKDGLYAAEGIDFGSGKLNGRFHDMNDAWQPEPTDKYDDILQKKELDGSFFGVIWDRSVRVRPTPVNPDSYLLISAGPDIRYGTADDVVNWTKREDK